MARAPREDWDPSEKDKQGCKLERDGLGFLAARRHMDFEGTKILRSGWDDGLNAINVS